MEPRKTLVTLAALLAPAAAAADVREDLVRYGLSVSAGGGLVQFVDGDMRDFAREGGGWEARLGVGTKTALTIEAAYLGSLHPIDALGLDRRASLLGTTVEGNFRVNLARRRLATVSPYFLAGVGWTRYSVVNSDANTSAVADDDDLVALPIGIGVSFRQRALIVDVRGVYRATAAVDMIAGASDDSLASWSATLRAGFEY